MNKKREPHEQMTEKNNHLSSAQEVTYQNDFNKADKAAKDVENRMDKNSPSADTEN
ncbi:YfhE family protein [Sporosarcina oncorhynchi]|uniref:YfhE family protein n=1 Tax=Sporosarcina oncorhynchi TaxID=3056444 RepID=A0ABZ0L207_9BACL|nr:YfhE family protein [Sporosarcina sp. T2O-4]WOV86483.1 YfhE family protein [Sporosarcina sp. T2O-4]